MPIRLSYFKWGRHLPVCKRLVERALIHRRGETVLWLSERPDRDKFCADIS